MLLDEEMYHRAARSLANVLNSDGDGLQLIANLNATLGILFISELLSTIYWIELSDISVHKCNVHIQYWWQNYNCLKIKESEAYFDFLFSLVFFRCLLPCACRWSGTNATDSLTLEYIEKMSNLNLTQLISSPTTIYKSNLDHIWISNTDIEHFHSVEITYYSDHMPLWLDIV